MKAAVPILKARVLMISLALSLISFIFSARGSGSAGA